MALAVRWLIIHRNWKHEYQPNQRTRCCHHFEWCDFSVSLSDINHQCRYIGIWYRAFVKTIAKSKQLMQINFKNVELLAREYRKACHSKSIELKLNFSFCMNHSLLNEIISIHFDLYLICYFHSLFISLSLCLSVLYCSSVFPFFTSNNFKSCLSGVSRLLIYGSGNNQPK